MMLSRIIIGLVMLGFMLTGCSTFEPKYQPADISLDSLEQKMRKTMDPNGVFRQAQSYVQRQMLVESGSQARHYIVETIFKRPEFLRMTTIEENKPVTAIFFDGREAWVVDYRKQRTTKIEGITLERMRVFFGMSRPDRSYQQLFPEIRLSQCILRDNKPYYRLECISAVEGQQPFNIYVGKNNFLTKSINTLLNDKGSERYHATIERYALYDNVMIPDEITVQSGQTASKYKIILYKLNVPLKAADFIPPFLSFTPKPQSQD